MPAGSLIVHRLLLLAALEGVVVQQLLDEVDVGEQHSSAAVPAKPEGIEGVTLRVVDLQELEVLVVLVANHLQSHQQRVDESMALGVTPDMAYMPGMPEHPPPP